MLFRRERHLTHLSGLGRLVAPKPAQVWEQAETAATTARSFSIARTRCCEASLVTVDGPPLFARGRGVRARDRPWPSAEGEPV